MQELPILADAIDLNVKSRLSKSLLPVSVIRTHTNFPPAQLALHPMVQSAPTTHDSPVTDVIVAMHKHTNPHGTIPRDQGF